MVKQVNCRCSAIEVAPVTVATDAQKVVEMLQTLKLYGWAVAYTTEAVCGDRPQKTLQKRERVLLKKLLTYLLGRKPTEAEITAAAVE